MSDVHEIRDVDVVAIASFIIRMLHLIEVYFCCGDFFVKIQHKQDIERALDYLYIGLIPKSFVDKIISIYPDQEVQHGDSFDCIEDAISYVNEGLVAIRANMYIKKSSMTHPYLTRWTMTRESGRRRILSGCEKAKRELEHFQEIYKLATKYVPDFRSIADRAKYAFKKHWLPIDLEQAKMDARSSSRQLRALGFVA